MGILCPSTTEFKLCKQKILSHFIDRGEEWQDDRRMCTARWHLLLARKTGCTFKKERLIWSPSHAFSSRKCSRSKPPPEPRPAHKTQ